MDISISDVWITNCTFVSSRSRMPPYMFPSCTSICFSSVIASDSSAAMPPLCRSPMVSGGIIEMFHFGFRSRNLRRLPLSTLTNHDSHSQIINRSPEGVILAGWEDVEVLGPLEEEVGENLHEGSEAGVGKNTSRYRLNVHLRRCIYRGCSPPVGLLSCVLNLYTLISVEEKGVTSNTENGREVCFYFAHMAIYCSIICPMSMLFLDIIDQRKAIVGWRRIDSFWDVIIDLLMNQNQYRVATLMSLFSIDTPVSIHLGVVSEMRGTSQPL
ncbi:hypothetical protein H5410_061504, partial [Solanum commersonii]